MKTKQWIAVAGVAGLVCLAAETVLSQNVPPWAGGFDPAQFQKMIMDGYREQLEIADDTEWKVIQERIQKVMDCRRDIGFGGMGMMARMFRRGGSGNAPQEGGRPGGGRAGFDAFGPKPSLEEEALQKAIDAKASNAAVKAALVNFFDARKRKQAALERAQGELRQVLSVRQEAIAALSGLL